LSMTTSKGQLFDGGKEKVNVIERQTNLQRIINIVIRTGSCHDEHMK
jgi:hypothetical protein